MASITLDLDSQTLSRVEAVARARQTSVEELLARRAEDIARLAPIELHNPGHRELLAPLDPAYSAGMSEREKINDRPLGRAETYAENRAVCFA